MNGSTFMRRLRLIIGLTGAVPAVFGLSFIVLVVQLFDFRQLGLMVMTAPLPVFVVGQQISLDVYFRRYARPIERYLDDPTAAGAEAAALDCAQRFPLHYWVAFAITLILAPISVMWSANLAYGFVPTLVDWFRLELVALVVSIIVGLPFFWSSLDLFGRAFADAELQRPQFRLATKIFLLGAGVPLLIDTMLVQYYWTATGVFNAVTFGVWLVLELLAIAGAFFAVRSFQQSLAPLIQVMNQDDVDAIDISALRPQSTDELGVLSAGYRSLIRRLQSQNETLGLRNAMLSEVQHVDGLTAVTRALVRVCEGVSVADRVGIGLLEGGRLRVTGFQVSGDEETWIEHDSDPALFERLETGTPTVEEHRLTPEAAGLLSCSSVSVMALRDSGQTLGALLLHFPEGSPDANEPGPHVHADLVAGVASTAASILSSAILRARHKEAELRYQQLTQFAPDAILLLDRSAHIVGVNDAGVTLLGPPIDEPFASFATEEQGRRVIEAEMKRARDGEEVTFDTTIRDAAGEARPVEVRAKRLPTEASRVMALVRDTSERLRLEAQLRHSQKMEGVGRLAGGIAHDFNNLLTAIVCCAELIERRVEGDAKREARAIVETVDRAADLTRQLLAFSRQQVLSPASLSLNDVVEGVRKILGRLVPSSIALEIRKSAESFRLFVDRSQLEQVLVNLVINARDAVGESGKIIVETESLHLDRDGRVPAGDWAVLHVSDDGSGIAPEVMDRIFEPYFTTKEAGKGTGLGLATVYGIVAGAGGEIFVESSPAGTKFSLYFHRCLDAVSEVRAPRSVAPPVRKTFRILLVEDDAGLRRVVTRAIKSAGHSVVAVASSGVQALQTLEDDETEIDILLSDVVMPGLQGPDLAQRALEQRPGLRVLLMSGYAGVQALENIARADLPFLSKPFTPAELLDKLDEVMAGARTGIGTDGDAGGAMTS